MRRSKPVVAIDGPSGVGKSTVAKGVASALNYQFIDTGAIYRSVAFAAKTKNVDWQNGAAVAKEAATHHFAFDLEGNLLLDGAPLGDMIRTPEMSEGASTVAKHSEVREVLLDIQRQMGINGGVVLEGRDIGTVVFPDAEAKFFLVASAKERARRRYLQLKEKGEDVSLDDVEKAQEIRDERDACREVAPLRKADDAKEVNCEDISANEVIQLITRSVISRYS
ncbi:MAG: (d)CMP kinase [Deltaproteobacteria bacterium]|nr:(d)CMP kinase [Deltaproteobacteria bacterium]